ncbi:hypothetical protein GY45DRAFT_1332554, partial [Cubamyces sp. BRFM 1775]
ELSIFSGRTARTVVTKSNRPQRISPTISSAATPPDASGQGSQSGSSASDPRGSQSPAGEAFPALESSYRAVIHPGLVDEAKTFGNSRRGRVGLDGADTASHATRSSAAVLHAWTQAAYRRASRAFKLRRDISRCVRASRRRALQSDVDAPQRERSVLNEDREV